MNIVMEDIFVLLQTIETPKPKPTDENKFGISPVPGRIDHAGLMKGSGPEKLLESVELGQALKTAPHLVLLGESGSGKSIILQFVGLCFGHEDWVKLPLKLDE